ncbi:aromatic acid exporter family protein [Acidaminobacter hydrogenoformans]|uniref:Uncharacterized membrane protein YgaE, UPF0421/DUF939 family n=1 Tax=Acidaminobacter hydrogenoformans DSM 2784 TaxID=1120920 RepID=A0A1G5RZE6_9FIRM|nr:aromatic acid exporter family protein [Acidaminobacter hydrogenoformans]SCZ78831.1 Uncharacterized membrane protein YgaE, UPF0421/DUF939 family [Acidaminobacter hydrogenoformans DSM 2784]
MNKENLIKSIKITLGVAVGVLIAKWLHMDFYSSVATIVIVSMLSDKKQSLKMAGIRLLAAVISLALSSIMFTVFGFTLAVFIAYIFLFTLLMYKLDAVTAIVLNVVLVMHIYSLGEISYSILLNEFGLMFLGITVALVINFFVLDIEGELIGYQHQVEGLLDRIFKNMGKCLVNQCGAKGVQEDLEALDAVLTQAKNRAYQYFNNYYFQENNYYVEYFTMRRQQYYIINTMQNFLTLNFLKYLEVDLLKGFTDNFVNNTRAVNTCSFQLERLNEIKHHFTFEAELPENNRHLQNRIALHQYLYSLEELVSIKMRFIEKHEKE